MKDKILLFLIVSIMLGCTKYMSAQIQEVRTRNRQNLINLKLGISKDEVLDIMGRYTDTLKSDRFADTEHYIINNPYKSSSFSVKDEGIEVLYYYTELKSNDGAVTDDELTPLVLIDDKLTGWGWDFWYDTALKLGIRLR